MVEEERGFAPSDPAAEEDLLAPEPKPEEAPGTEAEAEADEGEEATRGRRAPRRELMRLGWAALAVFAVIGLLTVVELSRISSAVNNNGCIQRAQIEYLQAVGPGVTPAYAGLDRLAGQSQLRKCS